MAGPKILIVPGSLRAQSYNVRLAALASKKLALADADVTRISLEDYPLPIYDADLAQHAGLPPSALRLKRLMASHHGVLIVSPEYNASVTPLIKNMIDWVSTVREGGEPALAAYQNRVFALGGASARRSGTVHALSALRQVLAVGCRAMVLPEQVSVADAEHAFDEMDELRDAAAGNQLETLVRALLEAARSVAIGRPQREGMVS
ncbi:MAG: NAD(P)H-dependent oxidoreductase [Hyphomicrobiales bacterium]|nr:NAD(P)H-dependent oxidoreductase [Hyphomicrobiales bacterium]